MLLAMLLKQAPAEAAGRWAGREHLSESYCNRQPHHRPVQIELAPAGASETAALPSTSHIHSLVAAAGLANEPS